MSFLSTSVSRHSRWPPETDSRISYRRYSSREHYSQTLPVCKQHTASSTKILRDTESMATSGPIRMCIRHARQCSKKFGIQCGSLKHTMVPPDLRSKGVNIDWVNPNKCTKILGVPFWMDGEKASFWESLYHKFKQNLPHGTHTSCVQSQVAQFSPTL